MMAERAPGPARQPLCQYEYGWSRGGSKISTGQKCDARTSFKSGPGMSGDPLSWPHSTFGHLLVRMYQMQLDGLLRLAVAIHICGRRKVQSGTRRSSPGSPTPSSQTLRFIHVPYGASKSESETTRDCVAPKVALLAYAITRCDADSYARDGFVAQIRRRVVRTPVVSCSCASV